MRSVGGLVLLVVAHVTACGAQLLPAAVARVGRGRPTPASSPHYELSTGVNNVYGRVGTDSAVVALGPMRSSSQCAAACIKLGSACGSFTWHEPTFPDPQFARHCFGLTTGYYDWYPTKQDLVVSGRVEWPCTSDAHCAHNGLCQAAKCACAVGWAGHGCQELDLAPLDLHKIGFRSKVDGRNATTWGGTVLWDAKTQKYHMWASEMTRGCGLVTWCHNSQVVHATSAEPEGPYERKEVVFPRFAHEPTAARDPSTGRLALFFTAQRPASRQECTQCSDGVTHVGCGLDECNPDEDATWMAWADDADGPWSKPVIVLQHTASDTNLSPLILPNGSLRALWRSFAPTPSHNWTGSKVHMLSASNWQDPFTYVAQHENIFPSLQDPTGWGGPEDPFLYRTEDGVFHAIFHNMYGCGTGIGSRPCGTHAYSYTGSVWHLTGSGAYTQNMQLVGGGVFTASARERPHLVLVNGTPTHLVTGTGYGSVHDAAGTDQCFTVVQPIRSRPPHTHTVQGPLD